MQTDTRIGRPHSKVGSTPRAVVVAAMASLALVVTSCGTTASSTTATATDPATTAAATTPAPEPSPPPLPEPEVPTIHLDTVGGEVIDSTEVWVEGQFAMSAGSLPECSAVPATPVRAKGRGNFTWEMAKKPYTLRFDDAADICGMGSSKTWVLLANHYDRSLLRTSAGMYVGSLLTNLAWTPDSVPVDLFVNGAYQGSYTLIEKVTVDGDRVDIDELKDNQGGVNDSPPAVTGGYLLEWDFRASADNNWQVGENRGWVGIKEPEDEDDGSGITAAQLDYIGAHLDEVDAALFADTFADPTIGWQKYIDAASAVDYVLAMELLKPEDANMLSSVLMYKTRDADPAPGDQGKLYFGPLWDMDTAMGNQAGPGSLASPTEWYVRTARPDILAKQSDVTWFHRLNEDPAFEAMLKARWQEIHPDLVGVPDHITEQEALIAASAAANFQVWDVTESLDPLHVIQGSWPGEVEFLQGWLQQRIEWMDSQLGTP